MFKKKRKAAKRQNCATKLAKGPVPNNSQNVYIPKSKIASIAPLHPNPSSLHQPIPSDFCTNGTNGLVGIPALSASPNAGEAKNGNCGSLMTLAKVKLGRLQQLDAGEVEDRWKIDGSRVVYDVYVI